MKQQVKEGKRSNREVYFEKFVAILFSFCMAKLVVCSPVIFFHIILDLPMPMIVIFLWFRREKPGKRLYRR